MNQYNQWVKTAQWVSRFGKKRTTRNDPFAHDAVFEILDNGFNYQVTAHYSPYATSGQNFTLLVKQNQTIVCLYYYPKETAEISIGTEWLKTI